MFKKKIIRWFKINKESDKHENKIKAPMLWFVVSIDITFLVSLWLGGKDVHHEKKITYQIQVIIKVSYI